MISWRHFWGPTCRGLLLGLLVFLLVGPMSFLKLGENLENIALDRVFRFQLTPSPCPNLLIVGIDEPSFQELRRAWPWPRRWHAELISRLSAAGASLIVYDVIFADPSNPEDDQAFADALRQAKNVILAQTFEVVESRQFYSRILVQPLEMFRQAAKGSALSAVTPDADGVVRRFRLCLGGQDTIPAAVARTLRPEGSWPDDFKGLIDFVGPPRSIETVSFYQLLDKERPLPAERIRNRLVLVGRTTEAVPQATADAMSTPFFPETGRLMSGVEIQGNIIYTLLHGHPGRELSSGWRLFYYLAVLLAFSLAAARLAPWAGLGLMMATWLAILGFSYLLFFQWHLWMPPVHLLIGLLLVYTGAAITRFASEAREKRWLRHALGRYVSTAIVENLLAHPERLGLGGERVEATILFADLADFTELSEEMSPEEVIRILNDYFTPMTQVVLDYQGTLDKYIGDCLMALWGAPVPTDDHALRACQAALKMQSEMRLLQVGWRIRGLPRLGARMGVHSGPVVAGNVGSKERFDYTVLGDTVNLAARLEGVNKIYGTDIILSEATLKLLDNDFLVRELDRVQVKGRGRPVTIFELLGPAPKGGPPRWVEVFAQGRAAYEQREFVRAAELFEEVLRLKRGDRPAKVFLGRCLGYQKYPPHPDWTGVFVLESK